MIATIISQVIIFRLRTGHYRLNHHLHRELHAVPSPLCTCGEANQDAEHILNHCINHGTLRKETRPEATSIQEKLYGPLTVLEKTTHFI